MTSKDILGLVLVSIAIGAAFVAFTSVTITAAGPKGPNYQKVQCAKIEAVPFYVRGDFICLKADGSLWSMPR